MTNEELLSVAEIVEKLTDRFNAQAALHRECRNEYDKLIASMNADHEAKMVEHRTSFGARTEADAKIIAGLRIKVQDARAERDALRAEVAALQERLRASIAQGDFAQMEVAALKSQTPKEHPVKVGEWVRRTDAECDGIYFGRGVIAQVLDILDAPENQYTVSRPEWNGYTVPWAMQYCEPCDPPEATHDTEAGKAAAESAVKTEPVTEEIKVGDLGEVFQATTRTLNSDVGITGCVSSIHLDPCHGGFLVKFDPSTQSRRSAGMQAFGLCDVRKVTT